MPIYELACEGGHRSETLQDRRPLLAHEGRLGSPLRAGDPAPPRPTGAGGAAGEGSAT